MDALYAIVYDIRLLAEKKDSYAEIAGYSTYATQNKCLVIIEGT